MDEQQPVIIVGAGLAGLVAAFELTQRKVPVIILDQEGEQNLGGQAFWSLGGIFIVDSREQRRMGIKDSRELALADWMNSAQFDRLEGADRWPRRWAEAFVDFAADGMEEYAKARGIGFLPSVGWAERGDGRAGGHGNSVPRFHLTWGTGPAVVEGFAAPVREAARRGLVAFKFRHQVDEIVVDEATGAAVGVRGTILESSDGVERGASSSRRGVGKFEFRGPSVLVSAGGIGGDVERVRRNWPVDRLGPRVPRSFVVGVPAHVDGRMLDAAKAAGASAINEDRMWHYTEGLANWNPIWPSHGIRVLPGPSSLWLDALGRRLPPHLYPGADTLGTLRHICSTGYDYSWFLLDRSIVSREFALSGSEQNPDVTGKSWWGVLKRVLGARRGWAPPNVELFLQHGQDFVVRDTLRELVAGMNELAAARDGPQLDFEAVRRVVDELNLQQRNDYTKDAQLMLVRNARQYGPERMARVAAPHALGEDPAAHGPLIAVRMNLLTRKTLGGLETDLQGRVMRATQSGDDSPKGDGDSSSSSTDTHIGSSIGSDTHVGSSTGSDTHVSPSIGSATPLPGLYAAGEVAGFGGGGVHGYNSLEGTFLGGCIFSGRAAGIAMAEAYLNGKDRAEHLSKL